MPNIILKINNITDTIHKSDNIVSYLIDASLGENFIKNFTNDGKMVLLCGKDAASTCKELNVDGIVSELDINLPIKAQVTMIREIIGGQKVFGAIIPARKHEAMLVSETDPDFVCFKFTGEINPRANDIIQWYNDLFLIQLAIDMTEVKHDLCGEDTDFIIINSENYENFGC